MSERSTGPAGAEAPADPGPEVSAAARPVDPDRPIDAAQPIELGGGPFPLTQPQDQNLPEGTGTAPKPRSRKILLSALLAVTTAGAAVLGYATWRISTQKDATLKAPDRIGSLSIDRTEGGLSTSDYLTAALAAKVDLDQVSGAVYQDATAPDKTVLFFGGTALLWSPESDLDASFDLVADSQGSVTGIHDVDPGELGGTMKCGATATAEGDLVVCGWADHGSLALTMFPNRAEPDAANLFREIRSKTQSRD